MLPPDVEPKVSHHIPQIIALIEKLLAKDLAYVVDGDVYYRVERFRGYGKLSKRSLDEMRDGAGSRVEVDERKESPLDFALWKAAKPGEPAWPSPWGPGRPGWHIECSAMSSTHLGETFDIHGGGRDLIFPHHENEIAQSQGAHGDETFARHWVHNGFINFAGEKMSKSLGNFFTIREILSLYTGEALRYFLMTVHYRHGLNFDIEVSCPGCGESIDATASQCLTCLRERSPRERVAASRLLVSGPNQPTTRSLRPAITRGGSLARRSGHRLTFPAILRATVGPRAVVWHEDPVPARLCEVVEEPNEQAEEAVQFVRDGPGAV